MLIRMERKNEFSLEKNKIFKCNYTLQCDIVFTPGQVHKNPCQINPSFET